jgi:hypothetical protein
MSSYWAAPCRSSLQRQTVPATREKGKTKVRKVHTVAEGGGEGIGAKERLQKGGGIFRYSTQTEPIYSTNVSYLWVTCSETQKMFSRFSQ